MLLILIIILTLVSSAVMYFVVRAINPNPEVNPTFQDCVVYSFIASIVSRFPAGGWLNLAFWVWVFNNKFYLNSMALVLCLIAQFATTWLLIMGFVKLMR